MPTNSDQEKVESYARMLLEAAGGTAGATANPERLKGVIDVVGLLATMSDDGNLSKLSEVKSLYEDLVSDTGETVAVEVTTAVELDDELRQKVKTKLEAELKKPVVLVERVDPAIMGGIIISTRNERRDASVRTQLQNMRESMGQTRGGGDAQ
ncbi:MAG: F0F1 ATP synthase subunit delta [Atopobiaceae bacterium]|nr:F0F1 ATP synthase subunit delta [Atopobiaceae bacterium]